MGDHGAITRRRFLGSIVAGAAGTVAAAEALARADQTERKQKTATDLVTLGKSGVKVSRLGLGTGTHGGKIQRELGQEKFTYLVRYAIERGVRFLDTADNYDGLHEMIRAAIAGIDREKIQIQCKIPPGKYSDPLKEIDRFRKEVGTDYFDSMLIHCVRTGDWVEQEKRLREALEQAKQKKWVRAVGVSMHGLLPLRAAARTKWGDIVLVRINHKGHRMDNLSGKWNEPGDVKEVLKHVRRMHAAGKGIIGMKLIGNGDFVDAAARRKSIEFVMAQQCVEAVVIGFKSPQEVDEAITNINEALAKQV